MSFHPASLAVTYEHLTADQMSDLYGDWATLASGNVSHTPLRQLQTEVREFMASLEHEYDHLARVLSTSYGFLWQFIENVLLGCGWQNLLEVFKSGLDIRVEGEARRAALLASVREFENTPGPGPWVHHKLSQQNNFEFPLGSFLILLKGLASNITIGHLPTALYALQHLDRIARESGRDAGDRLSFRLRNEIGENRCSSPIYLLNPPVPITANHILETFAMLTHGRMSVALGLTDGDFLRLMSPNIDVATRSIRPGQTEYWLLTANWITRFPNGFYRLSEDALGEDPEGRCVLRQFPIQFFAALDLALWPPFGPDGFVGHKPPSWDDLCPGWRFQQICDLMETMSEPLRQLPTDGGHEEFERLQELWCQRLHWVTPKALAAFWYESFKEQKSVLLRFSNNGAFNDNRWTESMKLLELRQTNPLALVLNLFDRSKLGITGGSIWVCPASRSDSRWCIRPQGSEKSVANTLCYVMHKILRSFLTGVPTGLSITQIEPFLNLVIERLKAGNENFDESQLRFLI